MEKVVYARGCSVRNTRRRLRKAGIHPAVLNEMFIRSYVKPSERPSLTPASTSLESPDSGTGYEKTLKL